MGKVLPSHQEKIYNKFFVKKKKPKLSPNSQPGVNQLDCSCDGKYIGKSKKRVLTRCIEHHQDSMSGKWESS